MFNNPKKWLSDKAKSLTTLFNSNSTTTENQLRNNPQQSLLSSIENTNQRQPIKKYEFDLAPTTSLSINHAKNIHLIDSIKVDYNKIYNDFIINSNRIDLYGLREIEEKLNRLVYRLDDIDVTDDNIVKNIRSAVINLIQDCLQSVQIKIRKSERSEGVIQIKKEELAQSAVPTSLVDSVEHQAVEENSFDGIIPLDTAIICAVKHWDQGNFLEQNLRPREWVDPRSIADGEVESAGDVTPHDEHHFEAPIQLLVRNAEGLFELNEAAIENVFCGEEVKNRKIAVVSVVGAFRRGKSCLLNFMLHYLKAQGTSNWLPQVENVSENVWLGAEMEHTETSGILMWPKPLLIDKNVAVVLLDTQVSFDDKTKLKENKFIFALSTVLSSVQVYNLVEKFQLDDLNHLQFFFKFGRLVENSCDSKVCDKLVFLVQDWKFPHEREFGFIGGQQVLQDWLNARHGIVSAESKIIEMLDVCYNKTSCFLMPSPGDQDHERVMGPVSMEQLREFTETVFKCELSDKKIGGHVVCAEEFYGYLKNYVEKLQDPLIKPEALFQSLVDTSQEKAMSKAKQVYNTEMQTGLSDAATAVDIKKLHQYALLTACNVFDAIQKFGGNYISNTYKKKLTEVLKEMHRQLQNEKSNQANLDEINLISASNEAYMIFHSSFSTFCMMMDQNPFCSIEEAYTKACSLAVNHISELNLGVGDKRINEEVDKLRKKMLAYYNNQAPSYNNKHRQDALNNISQQVLCTYRTMMDIYCTSSSEPLPNFDQVHAKAAISAQEKLNTGIRSNYLQDVDVFHANLCKEINDLSMCYKQVNDNKMEAKKQSKMDVVMQDVHHQAIDHYRNRMEETCCGKSVENIQVVHTEAVKSALALFEKYLDTYEASICVPYIDKTKQKLQDMLRHYETLNSTKQEQSRQEEQVFLMQASENYYKEEMEKLGAGVNYVTELQQHHSEVKNRALTILQPLQHYTNYDQMSSQVEQTIDRKYTLYIVFNQNKQLEMMRESKTKYLQFYKDKMKALNIGNMPIEDLEQKHENIMEQALTSFKELQEDNTNYQETFFQLKQDIKKQWTKYNDKNKSVTKLFENQEYSTIVGALTQMRAQYILGMSKHSNVSEVSQLFKFHEEQLNEVTANFMEMTRECHQARREEFLKKLTEDIKESYEEIEEGLAKKKRDLRIAEEKSDGSEKSYAVGIDLGTTNSCVAVYRDGKVEIIYSDRYSDKNKTTTPSVVFFKNSEIAFGETAIVGGFADPSHCISEIKRIIGRKFDDPVVQSLIPEWSFSVVKKDGILIIETPNFPQKSYKPEEISALVLGEMKRIAEVYLGSKVHDAVVTIPAYFNELQREATKAACVLAGLNVLRIINEPTAAAIAFGLQCKSEESRTLLLFDFGGGTCDISIVEVKGEKFTVKASRGDNQLGGEDFDDLLTDHVTKIIQQKYNVVVDTQDRRRLRHNCERVKRNLSEMSNYRLQIEKFTTSKVDVDVLITREEFENVNEDLFERVLTPVEECLDEAKCSKEKIDEVVMVGGTSRMPKIRQKLREFFNGKKMNVNINPDEAIAYGAAVQAAICTGEYKGDIEISDITPISLGVCNYSDQMSIVVKKNSKIPCSETSRRVTVYNYQTSMRFRLYQGECEADRNKNTKIGKFTLTGITPAPARQTKADVTFTIDADGILHVEAVEVGKENNKKAITIKKSVL